MNLRQKIEVPHQSDSYEFRVGGNVLRLPHAICAGIEHCVNGRAREKGFDPLMRYVEELRQIPNKQSAPEARNNLVTDVRSRISYTEQRVKDDVASQSARELLGLIGQENGHTFLESISHADLDTVKMYAFMSSALKENRQQAHRVGTDSANSELEEKSNFHVITASGEENKLDPGHALHLIITRKEGGDNQSEITLWSDPCEYFFPHTATILEKNVADQWEELLTQGDEGFYNRLLAAVRYTDSMHKRDREGYGTPQDIVMEIFEKFMKEELAKTGRK
ncbi:MAG TPA: hypothetical protein VJB82_01935 [Candidatus Peribacterales bacterium]|nr:hypothetical protein [Candidatus Peribacterales bacterium]